MKLNLLFLETTMKSNAVLSSQSSLTSLAFEWKQIESDSGKRHSCWRQFHYLTSVSDHNKLLIEKYDASWRPHIEKKSFPFCAETESALPRFTTLNAFNCSRYFGIFRHIPGILCPVRSLTPGLCNKGTINIGTYCICPHLGQIANGMENITMVPSPKGQQMSQFIFIQAFI